MNKVGIMTDSNCGIMPQEGKEEEIYIIPMPIIIDGNVYHEQYEIGTQEFYARLGGTEEITTSQPATGIVMEAWREVLKNYEEIVYVPMSSGLSSSCQTAKILAEEEEFQGRVYVVDNHRISVTQAESVYDAKRMAEEGMTGREIQKKLEEMALEATIYIAVDTLTYLKRGGRITSAASLIGTALNIKPILTIQGEKLDAFAKARGMKNAFKMMCEALDKELDGRFRGLHEKGKLKVGIANTLMDEEKLNLFKNRLQQRYPDMECVHMPLTMSIGAHIGPGGLGVGLVSTYK